MRVIGTRHRIVATACSSTAIQTISRTLHEEVVYDRARVTTVDWASYPILTFPEVPKLEFELIQRLDQPPLGVGEAASTPVPAALGNAVYDSWANTRQRLTSLMISLGIAPSALASCTAPR